MKLLIVQPWFGAIGHPAQSLINMASAIGRDERVHYLISHNKPTESYLNSLSQLKTWGHVHSFVAKTLDGRGNTVRALLALCGIRIKGDQYRRIFFFDAHLPVLAILWPLVSPMLKVERVSLLHLHGPEQVNGSWLTRKIVNRFLMRSDVRLYLRTEELASAWSESFEAIAKGTIRHLPSLEIPETAISHSASRPSDQVRFGILGQIRPGKSIDWLVPLFQENPSIGKLTIAGAFHSQKCRDQLPVLEDFDGFMNCFMSEEDMLERAAMQDYLLMLYGEAWDPRMESAVLYLAARVNRPVLVYDKSWSGRMVKEYGCGILAPNDRNELLELLRQIPRPGSFEYFELLKGMDAFRKDHSVESLRNVVLHELLG